MTRLHVEGVLLKGETLSLADDHVHYLRNVLRYAVGDSIKLFNQDCGEFIATICTLTKSKVDVLIGEQLRVPEVERQLTLLFCPIKNDALHYLIEKCTEVGVTEFQPVMMQYGNIHKINQEKLQRIATDAAQQCERLIVPIIKPLQKLEQILSAWDHQKKLYVCFERMSVPSVQNFVKGSAVLIGPEGGLHPSEVDLLQQQSFVVPMSLGTNILRAETAAVVASALLLSR